MATQDRRWEYAPDTHGLVDDISDALVCREGKHFLVTDADGHIPPGNTEGFGFYSGDTRHLSGYELLLNGEDPLVFMSAGPSGFSQEQVLGNRRGAYAGQEVSRGTIEMTRQRFVSDRLKDTLAITNHNVFDVAVEVSYRFQADFADIFEVRGHVRQHAGSAIEPSAAGDQIEYRYLGADGQWRRTLIHFSFKPDSISPGSATLSVYLPAGETRRIDVDIDTSWETGNGASRSSLDTIRESYSSWKRDFAAIWTDNELFNEIVDRAIADLRTLWTLTEDGNYFAAGVPWYSTLFGRDALITSLQTLPLRPELARDCLLLLARHQSTSNDEYHVQEPGKILHEMRDSELTRINELPYLAYFGSVDSTPLFLILVAEYFQWTSDLETVRLLRGSIVEALRWVLDFGRSGGDAYVRYRTDFADGLRNQGWKDSADGVMHRDGTLCEGPIALAEVQGYVYLCYLTIAPLLRLLDEDGLADRVEREAAQLRDRFNEDFWIEEEGYVALALDGANRRAEVMTSNAGQVLWSGILDDRRADHLRRRLLQNDMFSGWGIRTLSSNSLRYFPLGYHLGSIWPHDNALIGLGLKRYCFSEEVTELLTALFDAAQSFSDRRLPELFGGQPRGHYLPPVPYPVACRPQAWAAGALLQLLTTTLGLRADAPNRRLYLADPRLPFWLERVQIHGLRVGDATVNLNLERHGDETHTSPEVRGELEVIVEPPTHR